MKSTRPPLIMPDADDDEYDFDPIPMSHLLFALSLAPACFALAWLVCELQRSPH